MEEVVLDVPCENAKSNKRYSLSSIVGKGKCSSVYLMKPKLSSVDSGSITSLQNTSSENCQKVIPSNGGICCQDYLAIKVYHPGYNNSFTNERNVLDVVNLKKNVSKHLDRQASETQSGRLSTNQMNNYNISKCY